MVIGGSEVILSFKPYKMAHELNGAEDLKLWPPAIEKLFLDIMIEEQAKRNMKTGVFKKRTWTKIRNELNARANRCFGMQQLETKFNRLRKKHETIYQDLRNTGMGWDFKTNTVIASDEVWADVLAANPKAKDFWKKRCEHYHLLRILFNKITATGFLQISSNQAAPNSDEERELEKKFRNAGLHADLDDDSDDDTNNVPRGHEHTTRGKKRPMQEEWSKGKKTAKKMDELSEITQRLRDYTELCRARLQARQAKASAKKSSKSVTTDDKFSLEKAFGMLNEYTDLDDDTYFKVQEELCNLNSRIVFITMPDKRKKAWMDYIAKGI